MSAALGLLRLQQVDSRINQVEARLGIIREKLENDSEIRSVQERIRVAEFQQHELEHARKLSEEEAHEKQVKINQVEASLYGGGVHNPKELQDLQTDIVYLKKHLTTIEDRELEEMLEIETGQASIKKLNEELAQVQDRLKDEHKKLYSEQESLTHDLSDLQAERKAAISTIDSGFLNTYEKIRQQRRGVAVAEVLENACRACGTTLTAALQQSARHASQLVYCPSCGRILYAG